MIQEGTTQHKPDEGFTKKVLERVKATPAFSTVISTFDPVLRAAGRDWSIPRLMGTFGHAFCFSMREGGGEVWHTSAVDWWLFFDMFNHIGYQIAVFQATVKGNHNVLSPQERQALKDQTWEKVKASIDRGIPAIAWQPMTVEQRDSGVGAYEWGLLVGYDEKDKTYTVRHKARPYEHMVRYDQFGYTDPVQWYCVMVLGEPTEFDRTTLEVESLKRAVKFGKGELIGADAEYGYGGVSGFAAYELWLAAFQSGEVDRQIAPEHAGFLREARVNAAKYLREIADHFPETVNRSLSRGAAFYEKEVEAVVKLVEICRNGLDTTAAVEALQAALDAERKAIGEMEAALAALPTEEI